MSNEKMSEEIRKDIIKGLQEFGEQTGFWFVPKPKTRATQNRHLRLKFDGEYDNGDPYKDFELLVDAPEIPVTRVSDVTPMHAIKGDVLRERPDNNLTPLELRRGHRKIADPEWWQVRHLFADLKEADIVQDVVQGAPETKSRALALLEELPHVWGLCRRA